MARSNTTEGRTAPLSFAQLKCVNTLISKAGIDKEQKKSMVAGFSEGRCTSSRDLFFDEAAALIRHLKTLQPNYHAAQKMRNKILYYAHEMHWEKGGKVDIKRVDEWCRKFSFLHKPLDQYEYNELPKLVTQFEKVYLHFVKSI